MAFPFRTARLLLITLLILTACPAPQIFADGPTAQPAADLSTLTQGELLALCRRLQHRVTDLEGDLKALKADQTADAAPPVKPPVVDLKPASTKPADVANPANCWVVRIESNTPPDTTALKEQLADEHKRLDDASWNQSIERRLREARERYAKMSSEKARGYDNGKSYDKPRYNSSDLAEIKANVDKLEGERRTCMMKINKIETQIREAEQFRSVSASLLDGTAAILRSTPASAQFVNDMVVGKKYRVTGVEVESAKVLTITVKATSAVD